MIKSTLSLIALTAIVFSSSVFAQDTMKHSMKTSKVVTHKTTMHHKVVKKTKPAL
ncbi:MAG: hypothetical protein ACRYFL_01610 [Janthinobacterium lividum]